MATPNNSVVNFTCQNCNNITKQFVKEEEEKEEGTTKLSPGSSIGRLFGLYDASAVTIGVFGILSNFLSGVVFLAYRPLRQRMANYFLINQCLLDLLSGLFLILSLIIVIDQSAHPPNEAFCYFWNAKTIYTSLHVASCFNLVALTVDRYAEIVHPIRHKLSITKGKIITSIVIAWLIGFAWKFSTNIPTTKVVNGSCVFGIMPSIAVGLLVWAGNLLMEYLLPIFAIAACYIMMARSLRQRVQSIAMTNSQDSARIRMNIFKTLFFVVVCMALCLLLRQCILLVFAFKLAVVDFNGILFQVSIIISYLNCSLNPFIYLLKHQQFKKGFRQIFLRQIYCCPSKNTAESSVQDGSTLATVI